jgi:hypothetical protein
VKTIYALRDPRTGAYRYAGRTGNFEARMQHHRSCSLTRQTPLSTWLGELRAAGLEPVGEAMMEAPDDAAPEMERFVISFLGLSNDLLNIYQRDFFRAYAPEGAGCAALSPQGQAERRERLRRVLESRWAQAARRAEVVRQHVEDGLSFAEIGRAYGVTTERIRAIVRRGGVAPEVSASLRRDRFLAPWSCAVCGKVEMRLWRARERRRCDECRAEGRCVYRRKYTDAELLEHLRGLAVRLKRTPGMKDLVAAGGPAHTSYYERFGSLKKAQELAGLKPNERGVRAHSLPLSYPARPAIREEAA